MKFSVGDKIKLRKTGEEGVVVDIVQNRYLSVRVEGVVIPAEEGDLDFPYLDWFLKDRAKAKELENKRLKGKTVFIDNIKKDRSQYSEESNLREGLYLLFQPVYREQDGEDVIHRVVVYLFSEWLLELDFMVGIQIRGSSIFSFEGELSFQQKQLLYSFSFEDVSDNPTFDFEIRERNKKIVPTHFFKLKLSRKKLIESFQRLERDNLPLFELAVFTELKPKEKLAIPKLDTIKRNLTVLGTPRILRKAKAEIDLHIEKIYKKHDELSDAEKLQFQIDYFHTYLDLALADEDVNPLRVIHGIGAGILKKEIFSLCRQTKEVHYYVYDKVNPGVSLIYFKH